MKITKNKKQELAIWEVCQWVVVILMAVFVVLTFVSENGTNKSFDLVKKSMEQNINKKTLKNVGEQGLKRYYQLSTADYDEAILYVSKYSMSAEEILLIKVKDENQFINVQNKIQKHLENRKNDFKGYAPKQVELLENVQMSIRGKFVFVVVSEKAQNYYDVFKKSL